jgi:Tfp pilus assembly protein PilF
VSHQWYVHGKAQYDAGDYQGAVASFESAMNAGDMPEHARAGLNLLHALCLLHLGAFDRADELAAGLPSDERATYDARRRDVLVNTVAHQWYVYGKSQYDNHDYDGALASFDQCLASPDCTEDVKSGINLMRAMCFLRSGRVDQADETAQLLSGDDRAGYDTKRHELLGERAHSSSSTGAP